MGTFSPGKVCRMNLNQRIFESIQENMHASGKEFPYAKEAFLAEWGSAPGEIDVSRFTHLSNEDFLQAIYLAVMLHLPEEGAMEFWSARYDSPREQFQKEVLQSLAGSTYVAIHHIQLINNPYFEQKRGLKYHLLGMAYGFTNNSDFRSLGKKLPAPIQKLIRRTMV